MENDELVTIHEAQNTAEAELLRGVLEANGVDCVLLDSNASGMVAGFGPAIQVRLAVKPGDRAKALEILESFKYASE